MTKIYTAMEYRPCEMGSFGNAMRMLLRQYRFPAEYDETLEHHVFADSDRLLMHHPEANDVFKRLTGLDLNGVSETHLEDWFRNADPGYMLRVVTEVMGVAGPPRRKWTGFRILGSVGGNGYAMWSFELFAKHPKSRTALYDTENVPELKPMPRRSRGGW